VRHHAAQAHAAFVQRARHLEQRVFFGPDAGAMAVGVDLDQHLEHLAVRAAEGGDGPCRLGAVRDDGQRAAAPAQFHRVRQPVRRHADGVEDVGEAVRKELLGLLQRGHGDALRARVALCIGHVDALGGLHVRAKAHAERVHALLHALDVALHARALDERGGGVQCVQGVHEVVHQSR
jgi:hypothetical protein